MKKYLLLLTLALAVNFTACKQTPKETISTANLDAEGEIDTLTKYQNSLDEANFIKATCNDSEKEFKYIDLIMNPDPKYRAYYNRRKDGNGSAISFSRATHDDMRQKIQIVLGNVDAETLQYPYEFKFDPSNRSRTARVVYEVKKSGVPIAYYSDDNTTQITLTSYKDGILEGTFSAKVANIGKRVIDIKEGSFKMKLDKIEQ